MQKFSNFVDVALINYILKLVIDKFVIVPQNLLMIQIYLLMRYKRVLLNTVSLFCMMPI
jgi:hypothetical protein